MSFISLIKESCVDQRVDAIVNAANKYLQGGAGVCGDIFTKAGWDTMQAVCDDTRRELIFSETLINIGLTSIGNKKRL